MIKKPPSIINSTKPILYDTGDNEYPYGYAGSCFPVRWNESLYIVSAYHCYQNHVVRPECTLYPIPNTHPTRFFGFSHKLTAKITEAKDQKHNDQVILEVSKELHDREQMRLVDACDLSNSESIISLSDIDAKNVWLKCFFHENPSHEIDWEKKKIKPQAFLKNVMVSFRESNFDFCYFFKVKTSSPNSFPPNGFSPNGMSGSPVYAITKTGEVGLAGTIIEYNTITDEFLVIDSMVLRELLKRENM